jgi:DNA-directed RNA polymerase subunit M/transcription elongation factor TFIIS
MKCASCGFENRQGVKFCENCGATLVAEQEPPQSTGRPRICPNCGAEVRPAVKFCENCGAPLAIEQEPIRSTEWARFCPNCGAAIKPYVKVCQECGALLPEKINKKRRFLTVIGNFIRRPIIHRPLIVLSILFLILLVIGKVTTPQGPVPVISDNPVPLVTWEGVQPGERIADGRQPLTVTAWNDTGVARVETYVDGKMVSAMNNDQAQGSDSITYPVPLGNLGSGNHEVFTRVYGTDGSASQSGIIFIDGASLGNFQTNSAPGLIEPDAQGLDAPAGVNVSFTQDGKIQVSWQPTAGASKYRVYGRYPVTSNMILIGEVPSSSSPQYSFPVDQLGQWEVYVSAIDSNGREGALSHATIEVQGKSGSILIPAETLPAAILDLRVRGGIDRLYAYVRIGGEGNRYQRLPESGFLTPSPDGSFSVDIPTLGWPSDLALDIEYEIWGWQGSTLTFIGSSHVTIPPESWADGIVEFTGENVSASITLEGGSSVENIINPPPTAKSGQPLPPPGNIHFPRTQADCLNVATDSGQITSMLKTSCRIARDYGPALGVQVFFLWDWPWAGWMGPRAIEADLTGYEILVRMVNYENGDSPAGEAITSIPYPTARSFVIPGWDQPLGCGLRREWYIRAVGVERASDWSFVTDRVAEHCPGYVSEEGVPADYTGPPPNGCGGGPTASIVPEYKFHLACNTHDVCYESWWSGKSKETCDNQFFDDMWAACSQRTEGWTEAYCKSVVPVYYEAVNFSGHLFYNGPRNVLNCILEPAHDPVVCIAGYEEIGLGLDLYYSGKAVAKATYNGVVWIGEKTWEGIKWTGGKAADVWNSGVGLIKKIDLNPF